MLTDTLNDQLEMDESVMRCALDRMADLGQLMAAIYRLSGNKHYVAAVADLAAARRAKDQLGTDLAGAALLWLIEDEVLRQCRREVIQTRNANTH